MYKVSDLTPAIVAELKAELSNGRELHMVADDNLDDLILIAPPTKAQYKRFQDLGTKGKEDKAQDTLLTDCLVYPNADEWSNMLEEKPGLGVTVLNVLVGLAGVYQKAEAKKF